MADVNQKKEAKSKRKQRERNSENTADKAGAVESTKCSSSRHRSSTISLKKSVGQNAEKNRQRRYVLFARGHPDALGISMHLELIQDSLAKNNLLPQYGEVNRNRRHCVMYSGEKEKGNESLVFIWLGTFMHYLYEILKILNTFILDMIFWRLSKQFTLKMPKKQQQQKKRQRKLTLFCFQIEHIFLPN